MKINVKNEISKIKFKMSHQEMLFFYIGINLFLKEISENKFEEKYLQFLNNYSFDCQEIRSEEELKSKLKKMEIEIEEELKKINIY